MALGIAFWVAFFSATFGSSVAFAADVVADAVSGHDFFGNGTAAAPYQSLTKAMSSALPGDTVVLKPGTYSGGGTGEVFPVTMKPQVALKGSGALNTIIESNFDTALLFTYGNFDATARVEGITVRGTNSSAYNYETGIVIDGDAFGGYVTTMSPVITNSIIEGFEVGIEIDSSGDQFFPVDVSPSITNNIIRNFGSTGIDAFIGSPDSADISVQNNLLDAGSNYGSFYSFYSQTAVSVFAGGGGGTAPNYQGAVVKATIKNNTIANGYYGADLFAGGGGAVIPRPPRSHQVNALPFTTGGQIEATVSNNVIQPGFRDSGTSVRAEADGYYYYGGRITLNASRNRIHDYYGFALYTYSGDGTNPGGDITANITNNDITQTYAYENDGSGIYARASASSWIDLTATGNHIESNYGAFLNARGVDTQDNFPGGAGTLGYGGVINATLTGNVIDSLATGYIEDNYAVFALADGAQGYSFYNAYGPDSGGHIDLTVADNTITGTYGVFLDAIGASNYSLNGGGGSIDADLDRNNILGINNEQYGSGVFVYSDNAVAGGGRTGGYADLSMTNNVIRGYYGAFLYQDGGAAAAAEAGEIVATAVNNTIIGGSISGNYPAGNAVYLYGGDATLGLNPTLVNNILMNTSHSTDAIIDGNGTADNDPSYLGYNLFFGRAGAPLTELAGATQATIGAVNALGFSNANLAGNPQFTCPGEEKFSIRDTSPAIDAGNATYAPAVDMVGNPRPFGLAPDIGAFEFQGSSGPIFQDVPLSHIFYQYISAIYNAGITGGCSATPLLYCPDAPVSREQMAVFLIRALGESPDLFSLPLFFDVPTTDYAFGYVQRLAQLAITGGCGMGNYCPLDPVTRAQMAVFIIRALGETPAACVGTFADVTALNPYCGYIERLAALGITGGCGSGLYCPNEPVSRGQMGVFIAKAFNLMLPVSCNGVDPQRIAGRPEIFPEGSLAVDVSPAALERSANGFEVTGFERTQQAVAAAASGRQRALATGVRVAKELTETVHLSAPGVADAKVVPVRGVVDAVPAGPIGHVGPVANELLGLSASQLLAMQVAASPAPKPAAAATSGGRRMTRAEQSRLRQQIQQAMRDLSASGAEKLRMGEVRKQEKAKLLGQSVNPKLQAKWDARRAERQGRALERDEATRRAARAARRAAWEAKLGALWPHPKKSKQAPASEAVASPSVERTR